MAPVKGIPVYFLFLLIDKNTITLIQQLWLNITRNTCTCKRTNKSLQSLVNNRTEQIKK